MSGTNKFKRHSRRALHRIHITARITESAFTRERNHFEFATMIAGKKSISKFIVATMKHFVYIIKNGRTDRNAAINNIVKMVTKDLLNNTHN